MKSRLTIPRNSRNIHDCESKHSMSWSWLRLFKINDFINRPSFSTTPLRKIQPGKQNHVETRLRTSRSRTNCISRFRRQTYTG